MNKLNRCFLLGGIALLLGLSRANLPAQGNFDPAQFQQQIQQRMMDALRDQLMLTNDDDWKVVQDRLSKVVQLRMETLFSGGMGAFRGMGGNRGNGGAGGGFAGFSSFGQLPEAEALQNDIDANAPTAQIEASLERYRAARKRKEAELAAAQDQLRQVLSVRQEAVLVLAGMLN